MINRNSGTYFWRSVPPPISELHRGKSLFSRFPNTQGGGELPVSPNVRLDMTE